jgi:hypothetical protein
MSIKPKQLDPMYAFPGGEAAGEATLLGSLLLRWTLIDQFFGFFGG